MLSLIKEGVEDLKRRAQRCGFPCQCAVIVLIAIVRVMVCRHQADRVVNRSAKQVFRDGSWTTVRCEEICVGDVVQVMEGEECPADIIIIASSGPSGLCYIETGRECRAVTAASVRPVFRGLRP